VVPRETHPRPTMTRARTDHPRLTPALAHRRHATTVCTGTDSPATHLRVHSAPENAPGDALGGSAYLCQGEELGLPEVTDLPANVLQDPVGRRGDHALPGRDGCRVPLP